MADDFQSTDPPRPDRGAEIRYDTPEPWYYRFLEKYTIVAMWLGIAVATLAFLLSLWGFAEHVSDLSLGPQMLPGCLSLFFAFVGYALGILLLVFVAALILLAVDAARNLRSLAERQTG